MEENQHRLPSGFSPDLGTPTGDRLNSSASRSRPIEIPAVTLPRGGGALSSIDEKFSVNAVNGTTTCAIPLPFSPARGSAPSFSLAYNSGNGNGVFGMGWALTLPTIKRKTDSGLPRYLDDTESDAFVFSEAEELVPVFVKAGSSFVKETDGSFRKEVANSPDGQFRIYRYQPRIEGLFARIERWRRFSTGETYWRIITHDNVTTLFGWSDLSRIRDPANPHRVFEWLPEYVFDELGNCIHYIYRAEDVIGVDASQVYNQRKISGGTITYANRYLERVMYGNRVPVLQPPSFPDDNQGYFFSAVFDYGPAVNPLQPDQVDNSRWIFRSDPFSTFRPGFEVRTTRVCKRILFFHHFEQAQYNGLVRLLDFEYEVSPMSRLTFLRSVTPVGYDKGAAGYIHRRLPRMEFHYQPHAWSKQLRAVAKEELVHAPTGLDESSGLFTDLFGCGLSGILKEEEGAWYYKENIGNGQFANAARIASKPSQQGLGRQWQLMDLDGDGTKQLVSVDTDLRGFFELNERMDAPFRTFSQFPSRKINDSYTRWIDLNGDGKADLLLTEDDAVVWYESAGREGFKAPLPATVQLDADDGPRMVFADKNQTVFLADMTGDGLLDIVEILNGAVAYWPNLGHGIFGRKVKMMSPPQFDLPDRFDPKRIVLADIDGSGTTDLVYAGFGKVCCWLNLSGNSFSETPFVLDNFPDMHQEARVIVADLLGTGTSCIIWSSRLQKDSGEPLQYVDLMDGVKPNLMIGYQNNLGKEVSITYAPSTKFYLEDKKAGKPWATRLHFPVHVIERVTTRDRWRNTEFTTQYRYHHGYYDHADREYRGFGCVEKINAATFGEYLAANSNSPYVTKDKILCQPPILTISWFHTGAYFDRQRILHQFKSDYFPAWAEQNGFTYPSGWEFSEFAPVDPDQASLDLMPSEWMEALRSCKGAPLREEVYELSLDDLRKRVRLYSVSTNSIHIRHLQPKGENLHAVFLTGPSESITYQHDLALNSPTIKPDPRISHLLNIRTDDFGNVLQSIAICYPRWKPASISDPSLSGVLPTMHKIQGELHVTYSEKCFTNMVSELDCHRTPRLFESLEYELTGFSAPVIQPGAVSYFTVEFFRRYRLSDVHQSTGIPVAFKKYHQPGDGLSVQKRIIGHTRTLYTNKSNLAAPLPLGQIDSLGLPYETYTLALTDELLAAVYGSRITPVLATLRDQKTSGYFYEASSGKYWACSGIAGFKANAGTHFYLPTTYTDSFGNQTVLVFDSDDLFIEATHDTMGNSVAVTKFDYRVLAPKEIKDPNDNFTETVFDLIGRPVAVAVKGKVTLNSSESGESLQGVQPNVARETIRDFFTKDYKDVAARDLLGTATARFLYSFGDLEEPDGSITFCNHPPSAATIQREKHVAQDPNSRLQVSFEYSDGAGALVVRKAIAEPTGVDTTLRWISTGKTLTNNQGKVVKKWEPYFSPLASGHRFEEPAEVGVSAVMFYDAAGRLIRTENPNGTFSRIEFSNWEVTTYDANDTVLESNWYAQRNAPNPAAALPGSADASERAAWLAAQHAETPGRMFFDSLGRPVLTLAHNRTQSFTGTWTQEVLSTFTRLDIAGRPWWIRNAKDNLLMQFVLPYAGDNRTEPSGFIPCYDLAGNVLFQHNMDAGDRWLLTNAVGKAMYSWDSNERGTGANRSIEKRCFNTMYDKKGRPLELRLQVDSTPWICLERFEYCDTVGNATLSSDKASNRVGKPVCHYDLSGQMRPVSFDFKGNVREVHRTLTNQYKDLAIDWSTNVASKLDSEVFIRTTTYDALNRIVSDHNWHSPQTNGGIYTPEYNERGLVKSMNLMIGAIQSKPLRQIVYNEKGQKLSQQLACGTTTKYVYDAHTFKLLNLVTHMAGDANPRQDLTYVYDPIGNIIEISDGAIAPVFFNNQVVHARSKFVYDALYRLTEASGREDATLDRAPVRDTASWPTGSFPVSDPNALRNYTQCYEYDPEGNMTLMTHRAGVGSQAERWRRTFRYKSDSNHLDMTVDSNDPGTQRFYEHDSQGNLVNLGPTLSLTEWNYDNMLHTVDLGGGGRVWYRYGSDKRRCRKRIERSGGVVEDRIFLDGFELYRRSKGSAILENIETHHLSAAGERLLIADNVTLTDNAHLDTGLLLRFQFSNHIGSVGLELNGQGKIITYEEYQPFGAVAVRLKDLAVKATAKYYRFTGMFRDEESGFNYHGARYYAPWLARWVSADPAGLSGGRNLFAFCNNSPIVYKDPGGTVPEQMHLIESIKIETVALKHEFAFRDTIRSFISKVAHSWSEDPEKYVAGHSPKTPHFSSPAGAPQIVSPQTATSNAAQSVQERAEAQLIKAKNEALRASGAEGPLEFQRVDRVDVDGPPRLKHGAELADEIRDFTKRYDPVAADQTKAQYLARNDEAIAALKQTPSATPSKPPEQLSLFSDSETLSSKPPSPAPEFGTSVATEATEEATNLAAKAEVATVESPAAKVETAAAKLESAGAEASSKLTKLKNAAAAVAQHPVVNRAAKVLGTIAKVAGVLGAVKAAVDIVGDVKTGNVTSGIGNAATLAEAGALAVGSTATASVVGAFGVGYAAGTLLNDHLVGGLIDKAAPGSGALGEWYYRTFLK